MGSVCWLAQRGTHTSHSTTTIMGDNPEIWKAAAMADHFEKIQKLPEKIDGVPNFRRVPGYKVYCCGQPTLTGFEAALNKACGDLYPKTNKIIWLNMRQEPIVYVNGNPSAPGLPTRLVSMLSLATSPVTLSRRTKRSSSELLRAVLRATTASSSMLMLTRRSRRLRSKSWPLCPRL